MDGKKSFVLGVGCTAEDKQMVLDECMLHGPIPPKPSQLMLLLIRYGLARLRSGEVTLQTLYDLYAKDPKGNLAAKASLADLPAKAAGRNGRGAI